MASRYHEALDDVLLSIGRYRRREVSLDDLKASIWEASRTVSSPEERHLREALQSSEGKLDMIQFTVGATDAQPEIEAVLSALEEQIRQVF